MDYYIGPLTVDDINKQECVIFPHLQVFSSLLIDCVVAVCHLETTVDTCIAYTWQMWESQMCPRDVASVGNCKSMAAVLKFLEGALTSLLANQQSVNGKPRGKMDDSLPAVEAHLEYFGIRCTVMHVLW